MASPTTDSQQRRPINFGYAQISARNSIYSYRVMRRLLLVSTMMLAVAVLLASAAIALGQYPVPLPRILPAIFGNGTREETLTMGWRLPIAIAAVSFGALLGIGGAIFQSLTRNPLGSPDIIGFDAGAFTAVLITMLILQDRSQWSVAVAAIAGGIAVAMIVYALAYRRGVQGFRLILVGIGVASMLGSINAYLITRADLDDAIAVGFWAAGSLSRVDWDSLWPALIVGSVIVVAALALGPRLRRLELGNDAAATQGMNVKRTQLLLVVIGVSTGALVTAAAGPIGFIALVAPQIAKRLIGTPGVSILSAAAMGAVMLTSAHVISLGIEQGYRLIPVGIITAFLGGIYLIWLLVREARRALGGVK